jgi:toxin CcdB
MSQFTVYQNRNLQTRSAIPFLLDIQNELFNDLETRVVIPLCPVSSIKGRGIRTLMPILDINGEGFVMLTPQLAGIPKSELGAPVLQVDKQRFEIIAAVDFLLTGI